MKMKKVLSMALALTLTLGCAAGVSFADAAKYTTETTAEGWVRITQEGGPTLGYDPASGVAIVEDDGFAFKDLNKNGELDAYEDWRLTYEERAKDLVSKMTVEQMSGLRLNGAIGALGTDLTTMNDMDGNPLAPQILEEGKRYFIMYPVAFGSPLNAVPSTSNTLQSAAEATELGIPMMLNCDPTTTMTGTVTSLALGATFSPEAVRELSTNVAKLYRGTGITMSLSPQVDLESDPRSQSKNTFTEDPALAADLANAMISAYQSTYDENGEDLGWGKDSLAVQFKHFFGNLANEGGRNYHDFTGEYTVMTEEQVETQLIPFVLGGFQLDSKTGAVSAVMVTYTIPVDEEGDPHGEDVGGAFNEFVMDKLNEYEFNGMVSTDSLTFETLDLGFMVMLQTAYNVDDLTNEEKALLMFELGVDQIMGGSTAADVANAYNLYVEKHGESEAVTNWAEATYDCVLPIFEVGNFECPYLVEAESNATFEAYTPATLNELAQSSIVMLKNTDNVIAQRDTLQKAYIVTNNGELPAGKKEMKNYFEIVEDPAEAEVAIVFVDSPATPHTGYDNENEEWAPISLQYRPYTADDDAVLETSLTGETVVETVTSPYGVVENETKENRAYYDVTTEVTNAADLDLILETAKLDIPVVVCVNASGAFCVDEFESEVEGILVGYGVDKVNYLPLLAGQFEPSALLPIQMPANMAAVEAQQPGQPRDMECYADANGNTYDFGYGLNWSGVISDARTEKYNVAVKTTID